VVMKESLIFEALCHYQRDKLPTNASFPSVPLDHLKLIVSARCCVDGLDSGLILSHRLHHKEVTSTATTSKGLIG